MRPSALLVPTCLLTFLSLTGCSSSFDPMAGTTPPSTSIGAISGKVYGGRQPIIGAHVYLYAAGTGGYGGSGITPSSSNASTSLLTGGYVTTDSNGAFNVGGLYTCVSGTQIYMYSIGGDPGAGANTAAGLMAVLGQCPASGSLANSVPFVFMNEVSTVAAAYALAGFASDATHISSPAGSPVADQLAATGIATAFANAANLYNIGAPPNPSVLSSSGANATTPGSGVNGGTGTVPQAELNTLGNILAACVNSVGPGSPTCSPLLTTATSDSTPSGTVPTDTATAIINVAHFPAANVSTIFGIQPSTANPYTPSIPNSSQPNDFTVRLTFTGGGLTETQFQPQGLAIDGSGNAWIASDSANVLVEFSPLGVPVNSAGFGGIGLNIPNSVGIDAASANVWIANGGVSSVTEFNVAGSSAVTYTMSLDSPGTAQLDGSGNVWVTNTGNSTATKLNGSTGAVLATASGNGLGQSQCLSIEPGTAGNVWIVYGNTRVSIFTDAGAVVGEDTAGSLNGPNGSAIDAGGFVWIANNGDNVSKLDSGGTTGSSFALPTGTVQDSVAIDGAGNAWFTSQSGVAKTIFEFSNAGTNLSGTAGYLPTSATTPDALGIDGSGNVWYTDSANPNLYELVGAAVPVVTPIAYGVANSLLGTKP